MKIMRRIYIALLAVLAGLLIGAGTVYAGVNTIPPKVVVKVRGEVIQTARVHEFDWYYAGEDGWIYSADRPPGAPELAYKFPKLKTTESLKLHFVLRYPVRPERFYIRTFGGDFIGHTLYPVRNENGKVVAWGGGFYRTGHHRYVIRVKWPKAEGQSYGAATYLTHLKFVPEA
jgi:hypothetical protein